MIAFPHSKINLGLSIVSKRADGFHNLETIFYPLLLRDVLEIVPSEGLQFFQTGLEIPGETKDNLILRAYWLLKEKYPQTKPLHIYLHKVIHVGSGLGGGSADAAELLLLINDLFKLRMSMVELEALALELGSDCPFFIQPSPCYAGGRGEILEPLSLDLSGYSFLLVHPIISVDTKWAFTKIKPLSPKFDLKVSIRQPVQKWPQYLFNDFEAPVFADYPFLKKIKNQLYEAGALFASMTGSGSTIYGIFDKALLPEIVVENASQTIIR
ncbi:MAG: 4-(cytidine 5'-diphospho)-2-C-methyl-D-erythritol kinase [Bacteroidota bacterium]|nr:4-(cytidine 5'-diphospho)-2-C-methyl-D-erythritol kinase [Bacteroidota bacterium]